MKTAATVSGLKKTLTKSLESSKTPALTHNVCHGYHTKLHLIVKFKSESFWNCWSRLYRYYSKIHSDRIPSMGQIEIFKHLQMMLLFIWN